MDRKEGCNYSFSCTVQICWFVKTVTSNFCGLMPGLICELLLKSYGSCFTKSYDG